MATPAELGMAVINNGKEGGRPQGLKMLEAVDGLFVVQEWKALETVTCGCYESENEYTVYDKSGKVKLFSARETTPICYRFCCEQNRPFTIHLFDLTGAGAAQKMATIHRDYRFCTFAVLPCCLYHIRSHYTVDATGKSISGHGYDTLISTVSTPYGGGCCWPTLNLYDRDEKLHGSLVGPFCCVCDWCGADFVVQDAGGGKVGDLKKVSIQNARDIVVELTTDADKYRIDFPVNTLPEIKLALLSAVFHVDFLFFEDDRSPREGKCCDLYCGGCACPCCPKSLAWLCCCYGTKEAREEAEKRKEENRHGAPQSDEMDR